MDIICNGEQKNISPLTTLQDLALTLGLNPRGIVAELNGKIVEHGSFAEHTLREGDRVELIRFVGGG
ncbi:MAG TPA: thiamine biosynthesis protein ThiS [Desulfobulbaceae bacterium]|nr:thiamine biosynthesis protein ThiS [Desulfobulbaceae bacterium]